MRHGRSVGFGGTEDTALRYFRADIPARGLRLHGWRADVEPLVICEREGTDGRFLPWDGIGPPGDDRPAVMVLRTTNDFSMAFDALGNGTLLDDVRRAQDAGQRVVLDIDDDLWNIPDWSEAHKGTTGRNPAIELAMLDKLVGTVDAVSVSTPRIAQVVQGRSADARVELLRNGIDLTDFCPHEPLGGRALRVGWMGGAKFHGPHLRTIIPALDVLPANGVEFIHMGWVAESAPESEDLWDEIRSAAPGVVIGWTDWLDYSKLRQALAHIDIGLIPRVRSEFNEGQSTSSGMAYAAAGIPFLVAPSEEYRRFALWGAGTVCDTIDQWRAGLEMLITNTRYREARIAEGYRAVALHCGVGRVGQEWHRLLTDLVDA